MPHPSLIDDIRSSSRRMVRELGFMDSTLAATAYSPSAVHTLLEIENNGAMSAAELVQLLGLEKSSVSRMLAKLVAAGELYEVPSDRDGRLKQLKLTPAGIDTVKKINEYAAGQVAEALNGLDSTAQQEIARGLAGYAGALEQCRKGNVGDAAPDIEIVSGYRAGMIGRIAQMHGEYYATHYHFGHVFEAKVATGLAEFAGRLHEECNQIWLAIRNGNIVGSVAIDGQDLGNNNAHLRWFILDEGCRGTGTGKRLLNEAMAFCDAQGFSTVQLWTFSGLNAARRLYESFGFTLTKEWQGDQWGMMMTEQQFSRVGAG